MPSHECWRFGPFELDVEEGLLRQGSESVRLPHKPLALLRYLLERRGRTVPRAELLEAIWPGVTVSDAAFESVVRDLRRLLGDSGMEPRVIGTIRGRGLHVIPPVERSQAKQHQVVSGEEEPWSDVVHRLEQALTALDHVETSRGQRSAGSVDSMTRGRTELLVLLARARWAFGSTAPAREAFREAAKAARRLDDPEILVQAALGFAGRSDVSMGRLPEAMDFLEEALEALGDGPPGLRAELLARAGTEAAQRQEPTRAGSMTLEALRLAEASADASVVAYALTARHFVLQCAHVDPAERQPLAERAVALVEGLEASDVLVLALQERLLDALESGDGPGFEAARLRHDAASRALGQPFFRWLQLVFAGTRACLLGGLEEAERLAHAALEQGQAVGTNNAIPAFAAQLFAIRQQQERLPELVDLLRAQSQDAPEIPIFRAALVNAVSAAESPDATALLRDVFSQRLADFTQDSSWLGVLSLLAPAVSRHGEPEQARILVNLFSRHAGRIVVVGFGASVLGSVNHHLGVLHGVLGERDAALAALRAAGAEHARLGCEYWMERTERRSAAI